MDNSRNIPKVQEYSDLRLIKRTLDTVVNITHLVSGRTTDKKTGLSVEEVLKRIEMLQTQITQQLNKLDIN